MAGKAYLTQRRDREGKWSGGRVGKLISPGIRMGTVERGRTSAGVHGIIPVVIAEASPEDRPMRSTRSARSKAIDKRYAVAEVQDKYDRVRRGVASFREKEDISYQKPELRDKSRRERGTVVRPFSETVALVRGRSKGTRDVTFNRLSGRFVAAPQGAVARDERLDSRGYLRTPRRPGATGSAQRAKLARGPRKPTPDAVQTDKGGFISREAAAVAMFGPEEAARRLAARKTPTKKAARAKLAPTPEYVGRRRREP